jgi:hypothetical protein
MIIPVLPTFTLGSEPTILIRSQVSSVVSFAGAEQAEAEMMIPAAKQGRGEFFHGSLGRWLCVDCKHRCRDCADEGESDVLLEAGLIERGDADGGCEGGPA